MIPKVLAWHSLKFRLTLFTLLIVVGGIWSVAFYASRMLREDMQAVMGAQQFSTVTGIAKEIDDRLKDRKLALETIAKEVTPKIMRDSSALQTLLEKRPLLQLLFNGGVFITGNDGTAVAGLPLSKDRIGGNYIDRQYISIALKEGRSVIGGPSIDERLSVPMFGISAPIFDASGQVVGAIAGAVNLEKHSFLDPIAQGRYGQTGGFLLISPKDNLVVTATDKSRVLRPLPASGTNAMHDRYMGGYEGFGIGVSSRGVLELSAAKWIPSAGWFIVATLPAEEAFEPIDHTLRHLLANAILFTLLAGLLTWWAISRMLRQQFAPIHTASQEIAIRSNADYPILALPVSRGDEIGELIGDFNTLIDSYADREKLLKASESFKNVVLDSMDAEIAVVDQRGEILAVNALWLQFASENSSNPEMPVPRTGVGTNYLDVCRTDSNGQDVGALDVYVALQSVLDGRLPNFNSEYPCDTPTQKRWFSMTILPLGKDIRAGAVITHREITERKLADSKLQLAASVFAHAREAIAITDALGTIVDINEAFTRITGYNREEAIGQSPSILKSGRQDKTFYEAMWSALIAQGHWSGEIWNRRKDGRLFAELLTISAVRNEQGVTQQYVALFADITPIKEHQSELEHIAHFDALTNLPNRLLLADRLQQGMVQAQRRGQIVAVAYLDFDGFKNVNDRYGHDVGDQLLIHLATVMKDTLREGDTLARLGGDEFVAVLIDLDGIESCVPMLNRLLQAAAAPVQLDGILLQGSSSIGVTFYPQEHDVEADQLLRQADQAMYQAKLAGKNRYYLFDAAHDSNLRAQHETIERIRLALTNREFVLYYQPKVNMHSGKVMGAEALIRWQHPTRGLLAPAKFLPAIEDNVLSIDVGEWVIDTALAQMEAWHAVGLDLQVSVNISARQLQHRDFVHRLNAILAKHPQLDPNKLELEILETSALADIAQVSQVIEDCHQLGVTFALDDFGTGYSSLTYLKRLRVAVLKIDQSFVRDMLDDPDDLAILEGVIGLANAFKREVIAEGVETVEHGTLLLQLGCKFAQGYGIARPMPPSEMPDWATKWHPSAVWIEARLDGDSRRVCDQLSGANVKSEALDDATVSCA